MTEKNNCRKPIIMRDPPIILPLPKVPSTDEKNELSADEKAEKYILWGAGRAAGIALAPIPLADVGPLMANEAYMIYRIAETYGYKIDKSVVAMLIGVSGASVFGKLFASFLPFLKVPIAAGITYAVGKAAKAYFASGMTLNKEQLSDIFTHARMEADTIDWKEKKVDPEEQKTDDQQ